MIWIILLDLHYKKMRYTLPIYSHKITIDFQKKFFLVSKVYFVLANSAYRILSSLKVGDVATFSSEMRIQTSSLLHVQENSALIQQKQEPYIFVQHHISNWERINRLKMICHVFSLRKKMTSKLFSYVEGCVKRYVQILYVSIT